MVVTAHPTPLVPPRVYTPHTAAPLLGMSETSIRNQLRAAPLDATQRRVTDGPWQGAYRRGNHWRLPAAVVRRMVGSNRLSSDAQSQVLAEHSRQIELLHVALRAMSQALADALRGIGA